LATATAKAISRYALRSPAILAANPCADCSPYSLDSMRTTITCLFLCVATLTAAADPIAPLRFGDGIDRTFREYHGQAIVLVSFCAKCPSARAFIKGEAKRIAETIDRERLAAQLILSTPDGDAAAAQVMSPHPLALMAHDPTNMENVSLNNIVQVRLIDGNLNMRQVAMNGTHDAVIETLRAAKAYRYPVTDIDDERALHLWWAIERGTPGALKAAVANRKKHPQVSQISDQCAAREAALLAAPADLATVEGLEALLAESDGLPLKDAQTRLRDLIKDKDLKDEFAARSAWRTCAALLKSSQAKDQEKGRAGMAQIATRFPDTVYGKRAAAP